MTYISDKTIRRHLLAVLIGVALSAPFNAQAALDDIVIVRGENKGSESSGVGIMDFGSVTASQEDVCKALSEAAKKFLNDEFKKLCEFDNCDNLYTLDTPISDAAQIAVYDAISGGNHLTSQAAAGALEAAKNFEKKCNAPNEPDFSIVFTSCSMTMTQGGQILHWIVPPQASEARMVIMDANSNQFITGSNLETAFSKLQTVAPEATGETDERSSVTRSGSSTKIPLKIFRGEPTLYSEEELYFDADEYAHSFTGDLKLGAGSDQEFKFASIDSKGTATISAEVPGADVVMAFYTNFRDYVTPNLESGSLMGEMYNHMANVASKGMPLRYDQTIKMQMMIGSTRVSESSMSVESVAIYEGGAADEGLCGHVEMPDGWTAQNLDDMMAGAAQGGGSGMSAQDAGQINQAMSQVNQALQQLPPEQQAMISGMGLEALMPGGGNSAEPQATAPAASNNGVAKATGLSSADLTTDNMVQSVQLHLQALGYEPGNTNGELDINTQIAISEFEARKGRKPTGEPSPVLLGILAAEVDSQ